MIVFDTYTNTYQTGYVPGNVSEIVCDNSSFARSTYTTTSVQDFGVKAFTMFPNPADRAITLANTLTSSDEIEIIIFNMNGQMILHENYQGGAETTLDVSNMKPGTYLLKMISKKGVETHKLLIN